MAEMSTDHFLGENDFRIFECRNSNPDCELCVRAIWLILSSRESQSAKVSPELEISWFLFLRSKLQGIKNHIQNWDSFYTLNDQKRRQKACGARIGVSFSPPLFDQIDSFLYFWKLQSFPKTILKFEHDRILKRASKIAKWPSSVPHLRFWTPYGRALQNRSLICSIYTINKRLILLCP